MDLIILLCVVFSFVGCLITTATDYPILEICFFCFLLFSIFAGGTFLRNNPYVAFEIQEKEIVDRVDNFYFAKPVSLYTINVHQKNHVFNGNLLLIFPDSNTLLTTDEILNIAEKKLNKGNK